MSVILYLYDHFGSPVATINAEFYPDVILWNNRAFICKKPYEFSEASYIIYSEHKGPDPWITPHQT